MEGPQEGSPRQKLPAQEGQPCNSTPGLEEPFSSCPLVSRQALGGYTRPEPASRGGALPPTSVPLPRKRRAAV